MAKKTSAYRCWKLELELLEDLYHTPIHGQGRGGRSSSVVIQSQTKVHSHPWHSWPLQCPGCLPMLFWLWHLEVFAFLHSPHPGPLVTCAVPLLRVAEGEHQARAARGCAHSTTQGQLHTPVLPRPLHVAAGCSSCSLPAGLQCTALAQHLRCHLQARLCPSGSALSSCSTKRVPKQTPDPRLGTGMLVGGQEVSTALWL